jgi:SAM-dependent methyltransferase
MGKKIQTSRDGRKLLAVWRYSPAFESIHAPTLAAEWNAVVMSRAPGWGDRPVKARIGRGLPFADRAFDAIYVLHIFEHHREDEVVPALSDLRRILKPGAPLRISTPDLEAETRLYIQAIDRHRQEPDDANRQAYLLAVTRLVDQCVRSRDGGMMSDVVEARRWRDEDLERTYGKALDFLIGRGQPVPPIEGWRSRSLRDVPFALWRRFSAAIARGHPAATGEYDLLKPDEFFFRAALREAGFADIAVEPAERSRIGRWEDWDFDRAPDGKPIEPGLYIEAVRP